MPLHIARRLSMIVVLPAPLQPRISVRGLKNSIFCSSNGLKLRMPRMLSLSIELILVRRDLVKIMRAYFKFKIIHKVILFH